MKKIEMLNGEVKYFEEVDGCFKEVEKLDRWMPDIDEVFFFLAHDGNILRGIHTQGSLEKLLFFSQTNNCFRTFDEANRKAEIMELIYGNIGENKKRKNLRYYINFSENDNSFLIIDNVNYVFSPYYFPSHDIAMLIANKVGIEDWKKYVLGIYE